MLSLTSPVQTPWHRLPAGGKLLALLGFSLFLFQINALWAMGIALTATSALYMAGGWPFIKSGLRMLRPLAPFIVIVLAWHFWIEEPAKGGLIALRLLTAVAAANLVTITTRLSDIIAAIEALLRPFKRFGLNPKIIALAVALVIRFIPVMGERIGQLRESWRARSAKRINHQLILPATLAALDDAEQVAEALRARGGAA